VPVRFLEDRVHELRPFISEYENLGHGGTPSGHGEKDALSIIGGTCMKALITGGCGFIGSRLAHRLLDQGIQVTAIDNLSRPGSERNAALLAERGATLHRVDLSQAEKAFDAFARVGPVDAIFHLAAQVAVTTSYARRYQDFADNGAASFHVIESAKRFSPRAYCLYASTNKIYGHIAVADPVGMDRHPDPYTPYGVSKFVGEMYFTEYGRPEIGLATCSLRQSCIYGHHQYGVEDQGWMAWFAIANLLGQPITIYGDGRQTRDLLFVEDLIDLYLECWSKRVTGAYPVGGGKENAIDLTQGLDLIARVTGKPFVEIKHDRLRAGDQPYFVADCSWARAAGLDWRAKTGVQDGVERMIAWIRDNLDAIRKISKR
jgi:CDP-paratose 2-epimerase